MMKKLSVSIIIFFSLSAWAESKAISCKEIPEGRWKYERVIVFDLDSDMAEWTHKQTNRKGVVKSTTVTAEFVQSPSNLRFIARGIWVNVMNVNRKNLNFTITKDGLDLKRGKCELIEIDTEDNLI